MSSMKIILSILIFLIATLSNAQSIHPPTSGTIYNNIAQLNTFTRVLYIAAHPDDENTRLLAWLSQHKHFETAYLSLTRGDGGQNLIGNEQGAALGLIRTEELLAARKMDGAKQFFTTALDFGFSKNPEETFKHWDKKRLVNEVAIIIKQFKPDIIICRFPPDSRAGHGQHSASAIIARLAFEQIQNDSTCHHKPKRIVWNKFNQDINKQIADSTLSSISIGNFIAYQGLETGEIAGISRSIHRSQGAGTAQSIGEQKEYFELVEGLPFSNTIFDGINYSWQKIGNPEIGNQVQQIMDEFNFTNPSKSISSLLRIRQEIKKIKSAYWRQKKLNQIDEIIIQSLGLIAEATTDKAFAVPGETMNINVKLVSHHQIPFQVEFHSENKTPIFQLKKDSLIETKLSYSIPETQQPTQPYWLELPNDGAHFQLANEKNLGLPKTKNPCFLPITIKINEQEIKTEIPIAYKYLDALKGDVIQDLRIVPAIEISIAQTILYTNNYSNILLPIRVKANQKIENAQIDIFIGNNKVNQLENISLKYGTDTTINFELKKVGFQINDSLKAKVVWDNKSLNQSVKLLQYDHIPEVQYLAKASSKIVAKNWTCSAKKIGYLTGAKDNVGNTLQTLGLDVSYIKESDLSIENNLKQFDAIVIGIRFLNVNNNAEQWMKRLIRYAENGGTLIIQYNNNQNLQSKSIGPFPIQLENLRVTEENSTVTIINHKHQLLNYPNKITNTDFDNWIQERGLYFPASWDKKYQKILSMNDTNEMPLNSGILYTPIGKGHFIHTSLSFFRQLPNGNSGSIKLFLNMLSVGKGK